jgi:glycosyltransferase involved in cell wall biosynthesis
MSNGKRLLVVQYTFPPLGGAGVQRVLKFVKYLVMLGWEVKVLTTASLDYSVHDQSLVDEIPADVEVVRAREWPIPPVREALLNPLHRLKVPGLLKYVGWPDERAGWLPFGVREGLRMADRFRPDVVFSSSSPTSAHLIGRVISRARGIPWVADFRDPWTQVENPEEPRLLAAANRRLERSIVTHARYVTLADDPIQLIGLTAEDDRRVVIYNGVDEADLPDGDGPPAAAAHAFTLTHVGSLYGRRDAAPVFEAIGRVVGAGRLNSADIEVRLVGNVWLGGKRPSSRPYQVTIVGYVPHHESIREMRAAGTLLFFQPDGYPTSSGKIFEYLVAGRPILCVANRSNLASRLVEELEAGVVVEPGDASGIEDAICALHARWTEGSLALSPRVRERALERFSRRSLTHKLDAVLTDAASERLAPTPVRGDTTVSYSRRPAFEITPDSHDITVQHPDPP